uniref:Alpha-mannosidase n=1 Tax=Ascaris suum TaxID=6253 RepID=F1KS77_ASCSU
MRSSSRKWLFGATLCVFVFVSLQLYHSIDTRNQEQRARHEHDKLELQELELKLKSLEGEIKNNGIAMSEMRQKLRAERLKIKELEEAKAELDERKPNEIAGVLQLPKKAEQMENEQRNVEAAREHAKEEEQARRGVIAPPRRDEEQSNGGRRSDKVAVVKKFYEETNIRNAQIDENVCTARLNMSYAKSDIQMLDVYNVIPFDDPDGGVWKQGFDISYDHAEVQRQKKLEVIVTPHSHTDPGWITTFEAYYDTQTRDIFESMLSSLEKMEKMRFIYAEICFFERWWAEIDERKRDALKRLLKSGHLEIVSGAWVMTDEANSHYFATVSEMIEGHEWIRNHIGDYMPTNHWSIDPFGLSPTLAFLMSKANMSNAIVQRVHYSVKKYLAQQKKLEFKWRQLWSGNSSSKDLFVHVMPFYSYDIPHTCGPDPKICCQFDFWRLYSAGCPWNVPPVEITAENLATRAEMLYDQYRKKAQLFKTNVLFVPLGDDFRYVSPSEWKVQHDNYIKLFDYMNTKQQWNIHARFGTLADYFRLDHQRIQETSDSEEGQVPVLSGDFFTYADRNDHYWSGYYTSRPFYKRMDRVLQHYLRSAEILYSLARSKGRLSSTNGAEFGLLVEARRHMSLFQHHDGVTGTGRNEVVNDYGQKMLSAIKNCELIIYKATLALMTEEAEKGASRMTPSFVMSERRLIQDQLPTGIILNQTSELILFNSLAQERHEVVCVMVGSLKSEISRASTPHIPVPQQIAPVLRADSASVLFEKDKYELCFMANVPPFGLEKYRLSISTSGAAKVVVKSRETISSTDFETVLISGPYFQLDNEFLEAKFDAETGLLQSVTPSEGSEVIVNMSYVEYGVRGKNPGRFEGGDDLSGAYLFLPDGPARSLLSRNAYQYVVLEGSMLKKVFVIGPEKAKLEHTATIYSGAAFVQLQNDVDIRETYNFEVAMRLITSVKSGDTFFTDLNGYQVIRRKRFAKLPLQAHFYPMPSAAFIEDDSNRVSLLSAQALGVANLEAGWLEVMLDRRLNQDDGRGLFQDVTDNKRTSSIFRLMVEPLESAVHFDSLTTAFHSMAAHYASLRLHYPIMVMLSATDKGLSSSFSGMDGALPCDFHAVTLRTMAAPTLYGRNFSAKHSPSTSQAFILHRMGIDCRSKVKLRMACATSSGKVSVPSLLKDKALRVTETSLTLLYDKGPVDEVFVEPMDIRTFRLDFGSS